MPGRSRQRPQPALPLAVERIGIDRLPGVGPGLRQRLERLGLRTVFDLLLHLPLRYEDRTRLVPIGALVPGQSALVEGEIRGCRTHQGRRRSLLCEIGEGGALLTLRWFHFHPSQQQRLAASGRLRCFGEVREGPRGLEMVHPEYEILEAGAEAPVAEALTPVYPATEGVGQARLRRLVAAAFDLVQQGQALLPDWLADAGVLPEELPGLPEALQRLHRPGPEYGRAVPGSVADPARRRLALEELLAHHLALLQRRRRLRGHGAPAMTGPAPGRAPLASRFLEALPFTPTGAQRRVIGEIEADLARAVPMMRLVQGDVGCGKTVVATAAALRAVEAGHQAAVMAPTELLAEQHYRNLRQWCTPLGVEVAWLSGRARGARRTAVLEQIAGGAAPLVVGTHALFQDEVRFARLGLVVIDEQHRFGVHQRLALRTKGEGPDGRRPHMLIMTATPIPRTLAMTVYADLDLSVIDELPPGRQPVRTVAIPDSRREEVIDRIRTALAGGRQAYWTCTLIEESEALQAEAAEASAERLAAALPGARVGLVHGRMGAEDKAAVMAAFAAGEIQVLVATTVIEVGVDVPNASLMIIENAERLGLAQLHQLRGRVGRGDTASACVLLYRPPLGRQARERLAVMRETSDGFEIARRDLELRGPGEVLGTRQSGALMFRAADLVADQDLVPRVHHIAAQLESAPGGAEAAAAIGARWLAGAQRYVEA